MTIRKNEKNELIIPNYVKFGKQLLADVSGISLVTLRKEINAMLSDESIAEKFGSYQNKRFNQKQLDILIEELPFLDHLKGLHYE